MTDKELIQKIHSGDKEVLGVIIDRYYADIYRFCLYMIREENNAYDLTQEVFLKFIKYGISYTHNNLKGYLLTIARNICFDYFKDEKEARQLCGMEALDEIPSILNEYHEVEMSMFFMEILGKLPNQMREVVILRIYEEMKFKEIAKIMGCSISTTKSRFRLGIKQIKEMMEADNGNK